jgi:PTS system N-acetylglucosamine-specific IIC component
MKSPLEFLQQLGRSLMLPIAVLPAAALLLRLGQDDLLNIPFMAAAGDAVFSNLGLLFAMGVAVGFARENHGAAGLAGVVCFLIATNGAGALLTVPAASLDAAPKALAGLVSAGYRAGAINKLAVPIGIMSGLIGGLAYNRFSTFKLPDYLAFFGGRRFVPIVSGAAGVVLAAIVGFGYATIDSGVDVGSRAIVGSGWVGLFVFGALNRLLLVTGLHHILNNVAWFVIGDYHGATGDLKRFFAGDPHAGAFMSGFFPVMMFGLPAACLAMYHAAPRERRAAVGGMFLSLALTSLLTGVTEPIEFTFIFLAPVLFLIHALLTGASMALMDFLHVKLGFGFSAGLFDYVLNFNKSTNPLMLWPVGALYAVVYYGLFRGAISLFGLKTPGREDEATLAAETAPGGRGETFLAALGGAENLSVVDACTTRLRLIVVDPAAIDEARLKALGARGIVRPSDKALQVVLGPVADQVAGEIRDAMGGRGAVSAPVVATARSEAEAPLAVSAEMRTRARALLSALGGAANVRAVAVHDSRLGLDLADTTAIDAAALAALGARGLARIGPGRAHLLLGPEAAAAGAALSELIEA